MQNPTLNNVRVLGPPRWVLEDMYLVKQRTSYKIVDHYGVVVAGNALQWLGCSPDHPLVFDLNDKGVQWDWLDLSGKWAFLEKIPSYEVPYAIERLRVAMDDSNWTLFSNNCEQWANFIIKGNKESSQLQFFGGLAALATIGALFWANRDN
jgi:hypothetical protein